MAGEEARSEKTKETNLIFMSHSPSVACDEGLCKMASLMSKAKY